MKFIHEFKENVIISFRAIMANKMRALLTMLGIIIGIASVTLMGTAIEGLNRAFARSIAAIGADVLYVQKFPWVSNEDWSVFRNRRNIKIEHARFIEKHATLALGVSPMVGTMKKVKANNLVIDNVVIVGSNENYLMMSGVTMSEGRFLSTQEVNGARPVCVLGFSVAENLFPYTTSIGRTVSVKGTSYRVVGVLDKQGNLFGSFSLDNRIVIPFDLFTQQFGMERGITINVKAPSMELLEDTKEELRGLMRTARRLSPGQPDDFSINQQEQLMSTFNQIGAVIAGIGLFITGLSLFVGGIGIMNIMFVSVTERTKEIGVRKAIGAPKRAILMQFLIESAAICLVGGIIAIIIAFPLSLIIDTILPTAMPLSIVFIGLLVSLGVGLISGFLPAFRAARMDPVDALRYE